MMDKTAPLPPPVLIVAHGQPSAPGPAAAELSGVAQQVGALLPGWRVGAVTLAEKGALAARVAELGAGGLIYPMFMAGGWFTNVNLPRKLAEAGAEGWRVLEPFGTDPEVQDLAVTVAQEAGLGAGGALLLAAHGSSRSPAPAEVARNLAARIGAALGLARAEAAFIEQSPRLAEMRGFDAGAVCLPFFAANGGHVVDDLPGALAMAGFGGRLLPPLGLDPRVPRIIANHLRDAVGQPTS